MALIMVLGMMLLMGIMLVALVSSAVFGISFTSQTRASVQSVAAAEAGVDSVAAAVMNGTCVTTSGGVIDQTSTIPAFSAVVSHQATPTGNWVAGCPAAGDYSYRIVSTGYAQQDGAMGYDRGDSERLEALWVRPTPTPTFDEAIRGDTLIYFHSNTVVTATAIDGDIYTKGDMTCASGMSIGGSVVAEGNITWTGSDCIVNGDVYAGGSIVYPVSPYASPSITGNLVVLGNVASSAGQTSFGYKNDNQFINVAGTVKAGGRIHAYCSYSGRASNSNWSGYSGSGSACTGSGTRVQMHVPGLSIPTSTDFQPLALTSTPWSTYAPRNWNDAAFGGNAVSGGTCGSHSGGGTLNINVDTRIDTTTVCSNGVILGDWGGLTINLKADLIVYANSFKVNGKININSLDGAKHSVYFVNPSTSATTVSCPTAATSGTLPEKITMSSGPYTQGANTAVMFYTPGKIMNNFYDFKMTGQLYGCYVDTGPKITVNYTKVGDANSTVTLSDYLIQYIRRD